MGAAILDRSGKAVRLALTLTFTSRKGAALVLTQIG